MWMLDALSEAIFWPSGVREPENLFSWREILGFVTYRIRARVATFPKALLLTTSVLTLLLSQKRWESSFWESSFWESSNPSADAVSSFWESSNASADAVTKLKIFRALCIKTYLNDIRIMSELWLQVCWHPPLATLESGVYRSCTKTSNTECK